ncbi:hypothetical protein BO71DRAFT_451250 [Aspergillus ellipticus CBS 707.79]|uniref:3'-5' exonuclease domain-containing protein n=1 Tax=Aspergillus ellipticus CBS 707.79 TaxID=1448320 RepID=A0A319D609_9EURO|nr:hypothetical protein BO71DRAFT_451250 [Aspergillus ellipticus CBS 707.79]
MSDQQHKPGIQVVDSIDTLRGLLDDLKTLPTSPSTPSVYLDLEGINLCRHGSLSIVTMYTTPNNTVYIIDIHTMKDTAFKPMQEGGTSLRALLESPSIKKVLFDVRNDSDALTGSRRLVSGLAKCIDFNSPISPTRKREWKLQKERTNTLFIPDKGGRYEVFNERPFKEEIIPYCAEDVILLPGLYAVYNRKLNSDWKSKVQDATKDRIRLSQSMGYEPKGKHMALGPWPDKPTKKKNGIALEMIGKMTSIQTVPGIALDGRKI